MNQNRLPGKIFITKLLCRGNSPILAIDEGQGLFSFLTKQTDIPPHLDTMISFVNKIFTALLILFSNRTCGRPSTIRIGISMVMHMQSSLTFVEMSHWLYIWGNQTLCGDNICSSFSGRNLLAPDTVNLSCANGLDGSIIINLESFCESSLNDDQIGKWSKLPFGPTMK